MVLMWLECWLIDYEINRNAARFFGMLPLIIEVIGFALTYIIISFIEKSGDEQELKIVLAKCAKLFCIFIALLFMCLNAFSIYFGVFNEVNLEDGSVYYGRYEGGRKEGYGRIYNSEYRIEKIAFFHNDEIEKRVLEYDSYKNNGIITDYIVKDIIYEEKQIKGHGYLYDLINDKPTLVYEGDFLEDEKCGQGTMYWYEKIDENMGVMQTEPVRQYLAAYYTGSWAHDYPFGYGEYIKFKDDKKQHDIWEKSNDDYYRPDITILTKLERYRGTYWYGRREGEGILEHLDTSIDDSCYIIYHGEFRNNLIKEKGNEGAYYRTNGELINEGVMVEKLDIEGNPLVRKDGKYDYYMKTVEGISDEWPFPKDNIW